jgi:hypothetical protein
LFWDKPFEEIYKDADQTPEYERQREVSSPRHTGLGREGLTPKFCQIFNNDPARTVKLATFIKEMLARAQAACGPQNFNNLYAAKMDATVSEQLMKLLGA